LSKGIKGKMKKIVDLQEYRDQALKRKCFGAWEKRFRENFSLTTRLGDISDQTIYRLAYPGNESSQAFYELIMGALEMGSAAGFGYLKDYNKMKVVDTHLFLVDNIRFELMRRLNWVSRFATQDEPLIVLVQQTEMIKKRYQGQIPELSPTHPEYENYRNQISRDREALIRRLLPSALEAFKTHV
jgi:hypothetical protein